MAEDWHLTLHGASRFKPSREVRAKPLTRGRSPAARKASASVVPAIAQGNPNRVSAKCRRASRRAPCVRATLYSKCQLPRCNAEVQLQRRVIKRAERAFHSSAVCCNVRYAAEQACGVQGVVRGSGIIRSVHGSERTCNVWEPSAAKTASANRRESANREVRRAAMPAMMCRAKRCGFRASASGTRMSPCISERRHRLRNCDVSSELTTRRPAREGRISDCRLLQRNVEHQLQPLPTKRAKRACNSAAVCCMRC